MLTKVEARNAQGDLLSMELEVPNNGIILADVGGLDPVKATLVSSSFAQTDGTQFNSARREARNLTFKIEIEPDYIDDFPEDVRNHLYDFFMPKTEVDLRFYTDRGLIVNISGRTESFDAPLFVEEPEANISVMCFNPDFIALDPIVVAGNTVSDSTATLYDYPGGIPSGIVMVMNVNRSLTEFTIYHTAPNGVTRQLDFAASLISGDVVTIDTIQGEKGATLVRSGTQSSLLYAVTPQSNWIELSKGENYIRVYAEGASIPISITYTPRHGGL